MVSRVSKYVKSLFIKTFKAILESYPRISALNCQAEFKIAVSINNIAVVLTEILCLSYSLFLLKEVEKECLALILAMLRKKSLS